MNSPLPDVPDREKAPQASPAVTTTRTRVVRQEIA